MADDTTKDAPKALWRSKLVWLGALVLLAPDLERLLSQVLELQQLPDWATRVVGAAIIGLRLVTRVGVTMGLRPPPSSPAPRSRTGLSVMVVAVAMLLASLSAGCAGPWRAAGCEYSDGTWRCRGKSARVVCSGQAPGGRVAIELDGRALPVQIEAAELRCAR